ncbi:MAG: immunoglobulin-like domain-containing protein, partial [Bacteroidia bacterium]
YAQIGCFEDYGIIIGQDITPPVVTLIGPAVQKIEVNKHYTELGATAIDNLEGNISNRIVITGTVDTSRVGYYTIAYSATDLYGNVSAPVTRIVQVEVNQTGPAILLNGKDTVMVGVHYPYTETGATAKDNLGNNITQLIVTTGTPNTDGWELTRLNTK